MSVINSLRSGVGWVSQRNAAVRELVKSAKLQRLKLLSRRANTEFARTHPDEPMPPLDLMADAHAHTDYRQYYESGLIQARFNAEAFGRHFDFTQPAPVHIFEWGSGTGRVVRQMRRLYDPERVVILGSDYNLKSVEWCTRAFPDMSFFRNDMTPPLALAADSIDIVYCSSVFTHLSDDLCRRWMAELVRIVRPGGLISFTVGGLKFVHRYKEHERTKYRRGVPIYHEWDEVGRRDYFSWHPPQYVRSVFLAGLEELEHVPSEVSGLKQDFWLARVNG